MNTVFRVTVAFSKTGKSNGIWTFLIFPVCTLLLSLELETRDLLQRVHLPI